MAGFSDKLHAIEDMKRKYDTIRNAKFDQQSGGSELIDFLHEWCKTTLELVNNFRPEEVADREWKKFTLHFALWHSEFKRSQVEAKLKEALHTVRIEREISNAAFENATALEDIVRSAEDITERERKLNASLNANKELKRRFGATKEKNRLMRLEIDGLKLARETANKKLEEEQEKSLCHICLVARRDTFAFPCLHLHFCFKCLEKHKKISNTCPTCRTPISGILRCEISLS